MTFTRKRYVLNLVVVDDIRLRCGVRPCIGIPLGCRACTLNEMWVDGFESIGSRLTPQYIEAGVVHLGFGGPPDDNRARLSAFGSEVRELDRKGSTGVDAGTTVVRTGTIPSINFLFNLELCGEVAACGIHDFACDLSVSVFLGETLNTHLCHRTHETRDPL